MINQNAQSVTDAIHYSPGVTANAGTVDTRFDSIRVRGFLAPLYADGLILPSGTTQFGRPRPDPWGLERVEVLRGPSSALYGQIPPGGMINLVSLRPSDTPVHTVELQGTNFGQLQGAVDLGGKANEDGSLLYRLTALAHAGGTQIDNVADNRVMIQPALTWKPGKDTTLTILGQFQRDVNGVATQFLPAQGSLWYNPNGMLPASAFLGDPNDNSFTRSQFWLGYQLEHRFNDAITVRQNLRYASVNTNLAAVIATSLQPNQAVVNRVAYSVPEIGAELDARQPGALQVQHRAVAPQRAGRLRLCMVGRPDQAGHRRGAEPQHVPAGLLAADQPADRHGQHRPEAEPVRRLPAGPDRLRPLAPDTQRPARLGRHADAELRHLQERLPRRSAPSPGAPA